MESNINIDSIIGDMQLINATIKASDFLMDVFNIFDQDRNITGIIVTNDNRFYRMLSRKRFYEAMSKQFMFELFSKRLVYSFFDEDEEEKSLFLSSNSSILIAAEKALNREENYRYDPIIVQFDNGDLKLLDVHNLLLSQTQVHMLTLNSLKEANEFKKEIFNMVTHDLRNPLNSIVGFSGIIRDTVTDNDIRSFAEIINKAALQMNSLLNELLNSSFHDATELELIYSNFNLNNLIDSIIFSFSQQAFAKNQTLKLDRFSSDIYINADRQKIKEVIENLISNAIKYSEKNKSITITVAKLIESVEIKIKDQGPGFNSEDLNNIFGKFKRLSAKPTDNETSTGLGLYIVKKIIDKHNGTINVETELNIGSIFKIILPMSNSSLQNLNFIKEEKRIEVHELNKL